MPSVSYNYVYLVWHGDLEQHDSISVPLLYHPAQAVELFPRDSSRHHLGFYSHTHSRSSLDIVEVGDIINPLLAGVPIWLAS